MSDFFKENDRYDHFHYPSGEVGLIIRADDV